MRLDLASPEPWSALAALFVSFASCWVLARAAPRWGWVDEPDGERKLHAGAQPLVGGAAWLAGLLAALLAQRVLFGGWLDLAAPLRSLAFALLGPLDFEPRFAPLSALLAAFAVGLADDLAPRGLSVRGKLLGQIGAGCALVAPTLAAAPAEGAAWALAAALVLGAVVAQNAVNTFDNCDGAAVSLAGAALCLTAPWAGIPALGLLPFNLRRRDGSALAGSLPRTFLGDSGSHLAGVLLLLCPAAWPVLALPLLDLLRLCWVRMRARRAPWRGDRRHLAHELETSGLSPALVVLALLAAAGPSLAAARGAAAAASLGALSSGAASTALLFTVALACARLAGSRERPREPHWPPRRGARTKVRGACRWAEEGR